VLFRPPKYVAEYWTSPDQAVTGRQGNAEEGAKPRTMRIMRPEVR